MMHLLVLGTAILAAGPFIVSADEIRAPDVIFPIAAVEGWQMVSAELPDDFTLALYEWRGALVRKSTAAPMPTQDEYVNAIQVMLDTKAKERRYYDIMSACTYATSTNPTFKAEAEACMAWRDATWAKAYSVLDQVQAGQITQPTILELLAMLPTMAWPA